MTKVLHIVGGLKAGGIESLLYNLFSNLDREKMTFDFVKKISEVGEFERPIREIGGHIFKCPKFIGINYFGCRRWWSRFFDTHPDYKIIHVHDASSSIVYLKEAKKRGIRIVVHSHNVGNTGIKGIIKNFTKRPLRKYADVYLACSREAGEYLYGDEIVNSANYSTIVNGIDAKKYAFDESSRARIRDQLNVLDDETLVGHVGRFTKIKNHEFLLDIFAEACSFREGIKLLLIGDGPLLDDIKEKAKSLNISDKVIFAGTIVDSEKWYSAMDLFVFPSIKEGLGIAAIEAQAAGLSVIKSDGIPDSVDVTGRVITHSLQEPTINWVRDILQHPVDSRTGFDEVVAKAGFDIKKSVEMLESIYG